MFDRHTLCHFALAAVYAATGVSLLLEKALAHTGCVFAAGLIYAALGCLRSGERRG